MSWRFRVKVGPFVYDGQLGGEPDRRPVLLKPGDVVVLGLCAVFLVGTVIMAVITS